VLGLCDFGTYVFHAKVHQQGQNLELGWQYNCIPHACWTGLRTDPVAHVLLYFSFNKCTRASQDLVCLLSFSFFYWKKNTLWSYYILLTLEFGTVVVVRKLNDKPRNRLLTKAVESADLGSVQPTEAVFVISCLISSSKHGLIFIFSFLYQKDPKDNFYYK